MNNVIFSTKGTGKAMKILLMIVSVMPILTSIIIFKQYSGLNNTYIYYVSTTYKNYMLFLLFSAILMLIFGLYMAIFSFNLFTAYVDVYQDRFIGKGFPKMKMYSFPQAFNLKNEQISHITIAGTSLCIHTSSGEYNIPTNKKTSYAILNYFSNLRG